MAEHIPTRYFSESLTMHERWEIMDKYSDEKWDLAKRFLGGRQRITKNGIIISAKAKEQLDIDLFPMIFITAKKGYMAAGCARFMMLDERGTNHFFGDKITRYIGKKVKLEINISSGRNEGETYIDIW